MKCKYLNMFLVALLAMTSLTSCLSDGDETIALENGNAKELIMRTNWRIKEWKGNPPSGLGWKIDDIFKFENNGTFRKWPSDGKTHNWHWIVDPKGGDTPAGITIDDYEFGWKTWGPGFWVLYYPRTKPDNPIWIINLGDEDDNEEHFGKDEPNTPDEPEVNNPTNIVSSISIKRDGKGVGGFAEYNFSYDKEWRISKLVYTSIGSTKKESTYCYAYSNGGVRITDEKGNSLYEFSLDAEGRIKNAQYFNGVLMSFKDFQTVKRDDYDWSCWLENAGHHLDIEYKSDGKIPNNSNIDINCFIDGYSYVTPEWCIVLAPFGFLGTRMPYLINDVRIPNFDIYFTYRDYAYGESGLVTSLECDAVSSRISQEVSFTDFIGISYFKYPTINEEGGHYTGKYTAVDLGLSVKWANCNLGASFPEQYGDCFAWGETKPKEYYDVDNCKWCDGTFYSYSKYCTSASYGKVDNKTILDAEDDAAHVNWGGSWRMPTKAEMNELHDKCTWTWTTQNNSKGYRVVGPNGNSIFLPAAGQIYLDNRKNAGAYGHYWTSSIDEKISYEACRLTFENGHITVKDEGRYIGNSVRPVCP